MAVNKNTKTNTWEVRSYYKDCTGKRKQKTKRGFKRKADALEWERNFKLKHEHSLDMKCKCYYGNAIKFRHQNVGI